MSEKKMELAKVEVDRDIFTIQAENAGDPVRFSTTFDDVDLFNAVNGGSEKIKDHLGENLVITDIIITSADVKEDINDDTSETVSKPCVHFYGENDLHLATLSNGVLRAARMLITCGFAPSKEHPITIKFKEIETKKGRAHTFDLISR